MDEYFSITDLIVKNGVLYAAAAQVVPDNYTNYLYSRGKVMALDIDTLTPLWETGMPSADAHYPAGEDRDRQFYGPTRFIGLAPKKLYVMDEGFQWSGTPNSAVANVDRVMDVDMEEQAVTGAGLEDEVAFFSSYSYLIVYGPEV